MDAPHSHISLTVPDDLAGWDTADETPTGSRAKSALVRPDDQALFIFKYPKKCREAQIWSELIASFIAGDLLDWPVQHVSIGLKNDRPGNLMRFFYDTRHDTAHAETFTEGVNLCSELDPDYDVKQGQCHSLPLLMNIANHLIEPRFQISRDDYLVFWARAFALDALISNTDRHAENWGVITGRKTPRMAPLYDHGTSMGCGVDVGKGLDKYFDQNGRLHDEKVHQYASRGHHHVRMDGPAKTGATFEAISLAFLQHFPEGRVFFEKAETVALCSVEDLLTDLKSMNVGDPYSLTDKRCDHLMAMLRFGRERIRNILRKVGP